MRAEAFALAFGAVCTLSGSAFAFCRTTTCDEQTCVPEAGCDDCLTGGVPLFWPGGCMSFSVQRDGSKLLGIEGEATRVAVSNAFDRWLAVRCDGDLAPGFAVSDYGLVECAREEYHPDGPNANIWMFRDTSWAHEPHKIAVTSIRFNTENGQIRDVDVEINSEHHGFALDGSSGFDLEDVLTHEAGHFLGLSHSCELGATMLAGYHDEMTTLEADDRAGICAVYPPGTLEETCNPEPRNGFSSACWQDDSGCAACGAAPRNGAAPEWTALLVGFGIALGRRRFRTSSPPRAPRTVRCR